MEPPPEVPPQSLHGELDQEGSQRTAATAASAPSGAMSDAMTSAMVGHFARELRDSLSLWPQVTSALRRSFNVHHGYVLGKLVWQLCPMPLPKLKDTESVLGIGGDWDVRIWQGFHIGLEEPDMYIPFMGFITYVLLCGIVQGLVGVFNPEVLSSTLSFATTLVLLEVLAVKALLFFSGAVNASVLDLLGLLGYKYFHLSLQLLAGVLLGELHEHTVYYQLLRFLLWAACATALWRSLKLLPAFQPLLGNASIGGIQRPLLGPIAVLQVPMCWLLSPSFPGHAAVATGQLAAKAVVATSLEAAAKMGAATTAAAVATNATVHAVAPMAAAMGA